MDKTAMDKMFERLLTEPESADESAPSAHVRAALFAALTRAEGQPDRDAMEKLAAYLDGALDAQEAEAYLASLGHSPDEIYELESAQTFLGGVADSEELPPAELMAAVLADTVRETPKPAARKSWLWTSLLGSGSWGREVAWAGGAAATVVFAVVVATRMSEFELATPTDFYLPPAQTAAVRPTAVPPQLPSAPSTGTRPSQQLAQVAAPPQREAAAPRDRRNEREAGLAARTENRLVDSIGPRADTSPSAPAPLAVTPPPPAPPPPPPAPAAKGELPESVIISGSLVRGSAAVGVPVTNLQAQDFARTGALSTSDLYRYAPPPPPGVTIQNTERYPNAALNPVKVTRDEPVSTFSVDVDTASYANVRRFLNQGGLPPADAVRVEEMVNYFDYAYATPRDRAVPFLPTVAVYPSPWNADTQILHIGIKGFDLAKSERPRSNLVFLIDTSGSMDQPNKLPLLKRSFELLVDQLQPEDRVAIVVYAGSAGTVLPPTPGWDKATILSAIERLHAGGSTAGGEGIRQAYELAKRNFDRSGVNRVLLATDGDFNVGITDPKALEDFIARERSSGVFLSVLGFGGGNYNDLLMQKLAQAGNGTAAYIDTVNEARKVFVHELSSTLFTIAKDVKVQIEFNPARVAEYRLIGYETRGLNRTDFNNDQVDAGDVGAGHTVTALYEITPVGSRAQASEPLRYGARAPVEPASPQSEIAFVKMRYKLPNEDESKLITRPVTNADVASDLTRLPGDFRFAAAVAGSAQLLRHDPYIKSFSYERAIELAEGAKGGDEFGYRDEFISLMRRAQRIVAPQSPELSGLR